MASVTTSDADTSAKYFRVKFDEGYIFRMFATDLNDLKAKVANHYWWGQHKPTAALTELTLKRHHRKKSLVHYNATAQGYPMDVPDGDGDF